MTPALWVRPEDVTSLTGQPATVNDGQPPYVSALVVGRNGRAEVDLFRELGHNELDLVRFLVIRWVGSFESDVAQDNAVTVLERYLPISQPKAVAGMAESRGTELIRINLVFGVTEDEALGDVGHLLRPVWEANVVVAPEDRRTASGFDSFTRAEDDASIDRFILANALTASGLWSGVGKSVYELEAVKLTTATTRLVVIQRVFVRAVLTGGLAVRTAARALVKSLELNASDSDRTSKLEYLSPSQTENRVKLMVRIAMTMCGGVLSYKDFAPYVEPERKHKGFIKTFWDYSKFCWDKIKALPGWIFDYQLSKISDKVTSVFFGKDGDTVVDATIDFGRSRSMLDRGLIRRIKLLERQAQQLVQAADEPLSSSIQDEHPEVWSSLRSLVFASLDGKIEGDTTHHAPVPSLDALDDLADELAPSLWQRISDFFRAGWKSLFSRQSAPALPPWLPPAAPVPNLTDEGTYGDNLIKAVGDVQMICPDPQLVWKPDPRILRLLDVPRTRKHDQGWMDTSYAQSWRDALQARIAIIKRHQQESNQLLATMQGELASSEMGIQAQLREVDFQLSLLDSRKESLTRECEFLSIDQASLAAFEDEPATEGVSADEREPESQIAQAQALPWFRRMFVSPKAFFGRGIDRIRSVFHRSASRSSQAPAIPNPTSEELARTSQDRLIQNRDGVASPAYRNGVRRSLLDANARIEKLDELREFLLVRKGGTVLRETNATELKFGELEELEILEAEEERVSDWIMNRESSFVCLLADKLNEQYEKIDSHIRPVQSFTDESFDINLAELHELSKKFVRVFRLAGGVPSLVVLALGIFSVFLLPFALVGAVVAAIPGLFIALLGYHRAWSGASRKIDVAEAQIAYASNLLPHVMSEGARLATLHPQVVQHLKLIAESLYRPWIVDDAWLGVEDEMEVQADILPSMMDVATVPLASGGKRDRGFIQDIVDKVIRQPGWRHREYRHLIHEVIGEDQAYYADRRPGMLTSLAESAQDPENLTRNGAMRIDELETQVRQQLASGESRPRVESMRTDPLADCEFDPTVDLGLAAKGNDWDEYLLQILRKPSDWGGLTITSQGWAEDDGHSSLVPSSYAFGPTRLKDDPSIAAVQYEPIVGAEESGVLPVEFAIRIDLTRPVQLNWAHLLEASEYDPYAGAS